MFAYRIRPAPSGRQNFARSRSQYHRHDHHRHNHYQPRCFDNCAGVSVEEWNEVCQRNKTTSGSHEALTRENETLKYENETLRDNNRALKEDNKTLRDDNLALKDALETSAEENKRLQAGAETLVSELEGLRLARSRDSESSERYRRRVAALKADVEGQARELERRGRENGTLSARVRVLTETVSDGARRAADLAASRDRWRKRADDLQTLLDDLRGRYERARRSLAARSSDLADRDILVEEQRRTIHRLETAIPSRRRYSFA
ncbi:hypothetical protein GGS23DRAFT_540082 [Durotheca rogersii]|uniref:uncharacterized protein n=1 Tax=Durotheca rogersii TaxID=419775 RepID=UPI00221E3C8E|nr:uncharacterized protein GGS23DRAFT_540082 [Durotheca rogersii]KAI5863567.1 hypothetical protein GGS23DRAFT_540082 [Durotheca rogersii]